ncbi:hypothetical protein D3C71_1833340 [compost metagenome]
MVLVHKNGINRILVETRCSYYIPACQGHKHLAHLGQGGNVLWSKLRDHTADYMWRIIPAVNMDQIIANQTGYGQCVICVKSPDHGCSPLVVYFISL